MPDPGFRPEEPPKQEGHRGEDENDRHEDLGDPVGEALDRCL